jgi:plasmid stabilization system protein ParE
LSGDRWQFGVETEETILAAVARLSLYPEFGRTGRLPGTRELVIGGTPYVAAYRIEQDEIVIGRLLHGAQRWPTRL